MENINRNYVNGVLKSLRLILNQDGTIEWGCLAPLQSPSPLNMPRKLISTLPPLMHNVSAKTLLSFDALSRPSFTVFLAIPFSRTSNQ